MSKIQIMTDSASDISSADEQKYSIEVIPFPVTLGDRTYTSRVDFNNEQFFSLMAQYDEIPKTAQITPFQFQEIYLRQAQAGVTDLILVLINSQGSATYDNSVQAVDLFYEEYPEYRDCFHIHSFDGMGYNALYGSPVVHAARMCVEGASLEESLANGENLTACQKSDCLIVVRKPLKAGGAKGAAGNRSRRGNRRGTGGQSGWNQKQRE